MASYTLTHTGQEIDSAVEKVISGYKDVSSVTATAEDVLRFTFHNVSINSRPPTTIISSIVFLLFLSTSFYSPHLISIFLL